MNAAVNTVELPRKRVLKDRTANLIYLNGPGKGQTQAEAAEELLTAILKVERNPEIVRTIMGEAELDESVWSGQLDEAIAQICDRLDKADPTDDVLADEFAAANPDLVYGQKRYMRYDGASWKPIADEEATRDLLTTLVAAKDRGVKPTSRLLSSVATFVRANLHVPDQMWDANPDIIVMRDKTLDIAADGTYSVRENRAEDYARDALPFEFDPQARCDVWRTYLKMLPPDVVAFLQEFAGYSLTGDTSYEIALWLLGDRGSGRSTFIEGLLATLGARAGRLGLREIAESRFGLPPLVGKTRVYATESPSDYVKSADTLINIISGEPVFIEAKGKDVYEYRPSAKIMWAMNSLPQLRDQHSGLWRRVKIVKFPGLEVAPNPDIKEAIKQEGPGVLVWALEGLRRLRERGSFDIPASVVAATEEYREDNDLAAEFLRAAGIAPGNLECRASKLTHAYNRWRDVNGSGRVSTLTAKRDWERLGLTQKRTKGGLVWLLSKEPPSAEGA
jgi:P4 family phage/plasmid primase-like protien